MKSTSEQNVGIWMDSHKAKLMVLHQDQVHFIDVKSEVEDYHAHGGYGSSAKYLSNDAVKEKSWTERKKHHLHNFFKDICGILPENTGDLYVMGPGETKKAFNKFLDQTHFTDQHHVDVDTADKMTKNQFRAKVLSHFNGG